jgi:Ca-activated chloride channel family protein
VNPRIDTEDDRFSTFAVDVDTGAYTIARRYLADGYLPDKDSVRVEEFVNYFDQRYAAPEDEAFAISMDGGPTPYVENGRYQMLRIGIQGYRVPNVDRKPANLTFVVDVSGSMDREDRLETVKRSLELLVGELRPSDQVGLVVYGSAGRVLLDPTPVENEDVVLDAIWQLQADGSTNAEEGLELAYDMARRAYTPGAINRVILASDGVANVGATGPEAILRRIEAESTDIQLVTVGFGMGNYNDVLMEQLADKGDGFYAYVDSIAEAERIFVDGLTGTLQTIAEDAKIQVEFNPGVVERYRLVGFENRAVADDQFRDDTVDAGEIGAGHSVTALYEVRLVEDAGGNDAAATVFLRWRDPEDNGVREMSREMRVGDFATSFDDTSLSFQLATTVAAFAEVLRESYWADGLDLATVAGYADRIADGALGSDDDVREFARLVDRAAQLTD